jgi:prepilin-type N-terminal cleavage/methylation domain-containing protein
MSRIPFQASQGVTLLELMITVAIIAILAALLSALIAQRENAAAKN